MGEILEQYDNKHVFFIRCKRLEINRIRGKTVFFLFCFHRDRVEQIKKNYTETIGLFSNGF